MVQAEASPIVIVPPMFSVPIIEFPERRWRPRCEPNCDTQYFQYRTLEIQVTHLYLRACCRRR